MPIRLRLAILFSVGALVVVIGGGYFFVHSLSSGLSTSLDSGLSSRAAVLTQTVSDARGGIDFQDPGTIKLLRPKDAVAQVLDPRGRVVESSEEAGPKPLVTRVVAMRARSNPQFDTIARGGDRFRVLTAAASRKDGTWTVIVAGSLEAADDAVTRVTDALLVGGALGVALAGLGAWLLATAALRPVERMRRQAADISEHQADSKLQIPTTRDEIAALGATMNGLLGRLQGALARQRAFVADAGHELRTPLAILRTELELADNPARSRPELLEAIKSAGLETERLGQLAEELLFLARSDDDASDLQFDLEPVVSLIDRSVQKFQPRADLLSTTVTVSGDVRIVVSLDGGRFRRAIDNLLDNALRYSGPGTTVEVRVLLVGPELIVEVLDEGLGFPESFLPHAFERFRRADDARARQDGGSGLGLAIVQAVAREHGGTAHAANRATGGALVSLHLPAGRTPGQ